jgi:transcriptional regulator with XRE-family HTH domain
MQLSRIIRTIRLTHHLTQSQVAERLGVTRDYISHIESGRKVPSLTIVDHMAQVFDYNPYYLKRAWLADMVSQFEEKLKVKSGLN